MSQRHYQNLRHRRMKSRLFPLFLILLVVLLFAPLCQSFVREVFVVPFLYIFWITRFLFETIPQATLWPIFILLIFLIMSASFVSRPKLKRRVYSTPEQGRIESWAVLIERAETDDYFKWRLAQQLQKLALKSIAHQKGQSIKETRAQLRRGKLDIPPDLTAYFQASLQSLGNLESQNRLLFWKSKAASPLDIEPARVAAYLEELNHQPNKNP